MARPTAVSRFAQRAAQAASHTGSVAAALVLLALWLAVGAWRGFPAWWHDALNAGGWIVAIAMLFLLQHGHHRDMRAVQAKLDELVRAVDGASDRFIAAERLEREEVERLRERHRGPRRAMPGAGSSRAAEKP